MQQQQEPLPALPAAPSAPPICEPQGSTKQILHQLIFNQRHYEHLYGLGYHYVKEDQAKRKKKPQNFHVAPDGEEYEENRNYAWHPRNMRFMAVAVLLLFIIVGVVNGIDLLILVNVDKITSGVHFIFSLCVTTLSLVGLICAAISAGEAHMLEKRISVARGSGLNIVRILEEGGLDENEQLIDQRVHREVLAQFFQPNSLYPNRVLTLLQQECQDTWWQRECGIPLLSQLVNDVMLPPDDHYSCRRNASDHVTLTV